MRLVRQRQVPACTGSKVPPRTPRAAAIGPRSGPAAPFELDAPMRTMSPLVTPARRSASTTPRRASSRWNRAADSSFSKSVWATSRSTRRPSTGQVPSLVAAHAEARLRSNGCAVHHDPGGIPRQPSSSSRGNRRARSARSSGRPSPCAAEIDTTARPSRARAAVKARSSAASGPRSSLVGHDQRGLCEESGVTRLELLADDLVVAFRICDADVDDVHEHPGPLDVTKEGVPQASAVAGALDEAGQVRDRRPALVGWVVRGQVEHPKVGLQGREGIVGDLGAGGREGCQQRGLARVRQAHEADVGDESQLEAHTTHLAGLALLSVLGRLVRWQWRSGCCRGRHARRARS